MKLLNYFFQLCLANRNTFINFELLTKRLKKMASEMFQRLICEYDKPSNVSQRVTYFDNFLNGMLSDDLFNPIEVLLEAAKTQVAKLNAAELASKVRTPGSIAARDKELVITDIIMDQVLSKVQEAGDADLENARIIFERHQLKIRTRSQTEKGEFEASQGKVSKTIDVVHQHIKGRVAYLYLISTDKQKWYLGAFGTLSMDTIDNINDEKLTIGTLYYLKSRTRQKGIYSDWSQIIEITCV